MADWLEGAHIRPSGENAFVVEYGDVIDHAIGERVALLTNALDTVALEGVVEVVPTFRSVLVIYDPDVTDEEAILAALPDSADAPSAFGSAHFTVPVCLTGEAAEDLFEAAQELGLSEETMRERLLGATYTVGMYGFAPGFSYLSGVDPSLAIPRRRAPRPPMPAGSLIVAGGMAALTATSMPTGWYVVGQTAITLFRPTEDPMVPFAVGDALTFKEVSFDELARLKDDVDGGTVRAHKA
ncbi:MAG: carboxyltransferase domain-containing protein [Pseudomonadota bacterium]